MDRPASSFTFEHTQVAKGVAILLMLVHHLFGFPERLAEGTTYLSILPVSLAGYTIEYWLAGFGDICVCMFLFLSGYGMYLSASAKRRPILAYAAGKMIDFLRTYWICFALFVPIGLVFFSNDARYGLEWKTLLFNFVGHRCTLNPEWWFVKIFLLALALFPLLFTVARRHDAVLLYASFTIFGLSQFLHFSNEFCECQFPFVLGMLFAKADVFAAAPGLFRAKARASVSLCVLASAALVRYRCGGAAVDPFLAPVVVFYASRLLAAPRLGRLLTALGAVSFQMWLVHSFFCYYYFQHLTFLPRLSVLVLTWLVVLSAACALVVKRIERVTFRLAPTDRILGLLAHRRGRRSEASPVAATELGAAAGVGR